MDPSSQCLLLCLYEASLETNLHLVCIYIYTHIYTHPQNFCYHQLSIF